MSLTAGQQMIGQTLAFRSILAAMSREFLLRFGSDAFIHMEQQAIQFCTPNDGKVPPEICAYAERFVKDILQIADGVPDVKG